MKLVFSVETSACRLPPAVASSPEKLDSVPYVTVHLSVAQVRVQTPLFFVCSFPLTSRHLCTHACVAWCMRPSNRIATRSGDVVFANSTCYGDDLMNQLAQGAAALKEGAIVVTMTDPVPSPAFEVLEEVRTKSLTTSGSFFLPARSPEQRGTPSIHAARAPFGVHVFRGWNVFRGARGRNSQTVLAIPAP